MVSHLLSGTLNPGYLTPTPMFLTTSTLSPLKCEGKWTSVRKQGDFNPGGWAGTWTGLVGSVFYHRRCRQRSRGGVQLTEGWSRRSRIASLLCMAPHEDACKSGLNWTVQQSPTRGIFSKGAPSRRWIAFAYFGTLHSGIIQCRLFCVWLLWLHVLFVRCIHVVMCSCGSFFTAA